MVSSSSKTEDVEQKYNVVLDFPNLELHSAAAEDNVGLVHYALTHGQPINSVLHGVQPIHAAAAGGSVSAMRMLIERGADVNAPRLPRRYSNEKKRGAPALGAAGATPLHFAAANGHVNIVRILLTCGAAPDKEDKLGQTPESLAEHNGHEDVLRAIQAYRHMRSDDGYTSSSPISPSTSFSFSRAGPSSDRMLSSPDIVAEIIPEEFEGEEDPEWQVGGSRKGKERALSFASLRSANSAGAEPAAIPLRMKRSLGGLWKARASRSNSFTAPPPPPILISPPHLTDSHQLPEMLPIASVSLNDEMSPRDLETLDEALEQAARETPSPRPEDIPIPESALMSGTNTPGGRFSLTDALRPQSAPDSQSATPRPEVNGDAMSPAERPTTPSPAEVPMSDDASIRSGALAAMAYLAQTDGDHTPRPLSPALSFSDLPPLPPSLPATPSQTSVVANGAPIDRVASNTSVDSNDLSRVASGVSAGSGKSQVGLGIANGGASSPGAAKRERHASQTSRRPSLPSILEKAAHPGAAFRAAIRRDSPETSPKHETDHRGIFRGRLRSNESALSSGSSDGAGAMQSAQNAAKRYMSKHSIVSLFRRSNSPPSRSPSPPLKRDANAKPIDIDELDAGLERLQRASNELDRQEGRSRSNSMDVREDEEARSLYDEPAELEKSVREVPKSAPVTKTRFFEDLSPNPPPLIIPRVSPPRTGQSGSGSRRNRARTGSEVIAPSPLANEWARDSDSDTAPQSRPPRRANSDQRAAPSPLHTNISSSAPSGAFGRPRSATSPTNGSASFKVVNGAKMGPGLDWEDGVDLRKSVAVSEVIRRESEKKRMDQGGESHGSTSPGAEDEFYDARGSTPLPDADGLPDGINAADIPLPGSDGTPDRSLEQSPEGDSTEREDTEKEDEVEQTTPTADNISEPTYDLPKESSAPTGRFRGQSFGSMTSNSSRISTPPGSSLRISSIVSDDSMQRYPMSGSPDTKPLSPTHTSDGRPRGISVSTVSSGVSGMGFQSSSTQSTSLTPPSALSISLGGAFPPVPEHEVAYPRRHPMPRRKVSSRAEAEALLQQNEDDILQLAQLPQSLDSSRSLAAQLAAYGESHAMQQEFADHERRLRHAARRRGSATEDSSDGASFVSARSSQRSGMSSGTSSNVIMMGTAAESLFGAEAPRNSMPALNNIYDKRAAAYRERLVALTTAPPVAPPSRKPRDRHRHRAVAEIANVDGSLHGTTSGESDDPSVGALAKPRTKKRTKEPGTYTAPSSYSGSAFATSRSPLAQPATINHPGGLRSTMPPPNADVISTRYGGMSAPRQGVYPFPHSYGGAMSSSLPLGSGVRPSTQAYAGSHGTPPYVSVFANKYTGIHDGGDSDDEEERERGKRYTMIENDWRGGHVVQVDAEAFKRGKWAALKGSIGRVGRR